MRCTVANPIPVPSTLVLDSMQPMKWRKQLVCILHVKAHAVVANEKRQFAIHEQVPNFPLSWY
jgi:hypothetical protein